MALIKTRSRGINLADTFAFTGTVSGAGGGKINQVIEGDVTTHTAVSSTSYVDVGLEATITPSATSSKILVLCNFNNLKVNSTGGGNGQIRVQHDQGGSSFTNLQEYEGVVGYNDNDVNNPSPMYLHSANTTSAIKYKLQIAVLTGISSGTIRLNNRSADGGTIRSSIVLMEVLA
jgi:hypothetical protein|tara:strand:+ start:27 stop:551 length:525 start_codon:yes stop_codon:yes gene_type:complete